jgi:hypothetical protein
MRVSVSSFVHLRSNFRELLYMGVQPRLYPHMQGIGVWRSDASSFARSRHTAKYGGKKVLSPYIWVEQTFPRKERVW